MWRSPAQRPDIGVHLQSLQAKRSVWLDISGKIRSSSLSLAAAFTGCTLMSVLPKHLTFSQTVFTLRGAKLLNHEIVVVVQWKEVATQSTSGWSVIIILRFVELDSLSRCCFDAFFKIVFFFSFFSFFNYFQLNVKRTWLLKKAPQKETVKMLSNQGQRQQIVYLPFDN